MKSKDCIPGEYYYREDGNYIIHAKERMDGCDNLSGTTFYQGTGCFDSPSSNFRLATSAERSHLKACQKAGRYVDPPAPEIIEKYQIY